MVFTSAKPIWAIQRYASHYINHIHKKKKKKRRKEALNPQGLYSAWGNGRKSGLIQGKRIGSIHCIKSPSPA